jgi:CheY-like chemotaxis protein
VDAEPVDPGRGAGRSGRLVPFPSLVGVRVGAVSVRPLLVTVGGPLVAHRIRVVALGPRLVGIGDRLVGRGSPPVAVGDRLVGGEVPAFLHVPLGGVLGVGDGAPVVTVHRWAPAMALVLPHRPHDHSPDPARHDTPSWAGAPDEGARGEMTARHDGMRIRPHRAVMDADAFAERMTVPAARPMALVVDDEPMLAALTAQALASRGWRTVVATAAQHAADLAGELEFDLLVTDLHMPGMSGVDLASSLRARRADLPIVLVSASPEAAELELSQPFAFLVKPFSLASLFGTIGALLAPARTAP